MVLWLSCHVCLHPTLETIPTHSELAGSKAASDTDEPLLVSVVCKKAAAYIIENVNEGLDAGIYMFNGKTS